MENRTNLLLANALRFGLALAAVNFIIFLLYYILEVDIMSISFGIISLILTIGIYFGALIYSNNHLKKTVFGGYLTYSQGLFNSFTVSAVSSIVNAVLMFLFYTFVDTEYLYEQMDKVIVKMQESGMIPAEQLEKSIAELEKVTPLSSAAQGIWGGLLIGLIVALIISAITKTKSNPFADQPEDTNTTI